MPETYISAEGAEAAYESARATSGPYNQGQPPSIKGREPYHLVTSKDQRLLDLHGQILCDSAGDPKIRQRVRDVQDELGNLPVVGPDFTHPELDLAQTRIAEELDVEYGGGPWALSFKSSGTRANEEGVGIARGVLGGEGEFGMVLNRGGYHGAGFMKAAIGQSSWRSRATMPLGVPVTHLSHIDTDEGRDYSDDFYQYLDHTAGSDGRPLYTTEAGVGGVMGFELISPEGIKTTSVAAHEKGGAVHLDNVQVMPFRTGDNFLGVDGMVEKTDPRTIPDIVTSAKGNGVGYPFAFTAVQQAFLDRGEGHFGKDYDTYARNIEGAAAFNALYEKLKDPEFQREFQENMRHWTQGLRTIATAQNDKVHRVTGLGFMSGLQLHGAQLVAEFRRLGMEETGIVCCVGGIRGDVLRLGIKLDSPRKIVDEALSKIEDTLKKIQ